jgi:ribosomal-protein-alanine N-acetyltransferase
MFELQTERLRLIALDAENMRLSLENPQQMADNLGVQGCTSAPQGDLRAAAEQMLAGVLRDKANYLWHTHWQIVLKEQNDIIGGLCFKGPPGAKGQVEVGYGIEPPYQGQGYMSETLAEILRWALAQPGVTAVVAETSQANVASHAVLQKAGFAAYRQTGDCLWWRASAPVHGAGSCSDVN